MLVNLKNIEIIGKQLKRNEDSFNHLRINVVKKLGAVHEGPQGFEPLKTYALLRIG